MYTASSVFLRTLSQYGITHAFVNWGSDHPALLEELERQRVTGGKTDLEIITCPNEMVALSAAQGYAQVTGKPAAVIVHVDVGTQGMGGAVHNVDRCRTPVLIYAGASPFTFEGELKGTRFDFAMTLQDVPDQTAIVRQYMRYTGQFNSGKDVRQVTLRGLQIATSEPRGPVYVWARREVMEEEVDESLVNAPVDKQFWAPVDPIALSPNAVRTISEALTTAQKPLIIASYLGRNLRAVDKLVELSEKWAIPVYQCCPTTVNFPHDHPNFIDLSFGLAEDKCVREADVILIIDSDVPYIPIHNKPRPDAKIFHIDVDVLKYDIGMFHVDAILRCQADAEVALGQLIDHLSVSSVDDVAIKARARLLADNHSNRMKLLDAAESSFPEDGSMTVPNIIGVLRKNSPNHNLVLNESITNFLPVWNHMRPNLPGSMVSAGASALGWGLGAAVGACLGGRVIGKEHDLITLIVGDGSFLFGIPASAFWIARRYKTPFLTIVLNNGGWKSPKVSMLGVHPNGLGSKASGRQLTVGFGPEDPDYPQIAVAAGGAWGKRISLASELEGAIVEAIKVVTEERRCAVLECLIESI